MYLRVIVCLFVVCLSGHLFNLVITLAPDAGDKEGNGQQLCAGKDHGAEKAQQEQANKQCAICFADLAPMGDGERGWLFCVSFHFLSCRRLFLHYPLYSIPYYY